MCYITDLTIKCSKTHIQRFVLLVICCYLVVTGHCCKSSGADFMRLVFMPHLVHCVIHRNINYCELSPSTHELWLLYTVY